MAIVITNFSGGIDPVEPSESLWFTANFLYALCGRQIPYARSVIAAGGNIAPITPAVENLYPFFITSGDFEPDGITYVNTAIVGDELSLFANQFAQQFLLSGVNTFSYTGNGFVINIPGFDANTQDWLIRVEKIENE